MGFGEVKLSFMLGICHQVWPHIQYKFTTYIGFCFVFFQDDESIDADIQKSVAPRIVSVRRLADLNPIYIVAEGMFVCQLCNLSMGMSIALLLGCYYIFNMKYPSTSKNIFIFLEAIMLNNGSKAKKRVAINKFFKELS